MLEAVGHPVVVNPDRLLRELALDRDWEILFFEPRRLLRIAIAGGAAAGAAAALGGYFLVRDQLRGSPTSTAPRRMRPSRPGS
jgi:hypothetical protein